MDAKIVNFRRSRRVTSGNNMIIMVSDVDTLEKAEKLVGKKVVYDTGKSKINGEIKATHGNSGAVRAIFEKGMPGQSVGKKVVIS